MRQHLAAVLALFMVAWVSSAHALDRAGAIEVAKRQVKNQCATAEFCTFDATLENNKWHVRVEIADGKPLPQRKPAIFVIDQSGRIVGRIEGR
jgi:hypothetical protein